VLEISPKIATLPPKKIKKKKIIKNYSHQRWTVASNFRILFHFIQVGQKIATKIHQRVCDVLQKGFPVIFFLKQTKNIT